MTIKKSVILLTVFFMLFSFAGCSVTFIKRHPKDVEKLGKLRGEVEQLSEELKRTKEQDKKELEEAKAALERDLRKEIEDKKVALEVLERGLVITFVAEVLFDSGKAKLKEEASGALDKVAEVINNEVKDRNIAIEGHTDNQPIKYSGWKSNWELSTARATTVLHYFEDAGIEPGKLQATGYGEYRPVVSNDTREGRQENRRVEIVILPSEIGKVPYGKEVPDIK